jgi:hypothetical protein
VDDLLVVDDQDPEASLALLGVGKDARGTLSSSCGHGR